MRGLLIMAFLFCSMGIKAQTHLPFYSMNYMPQTMFAGSRFINNDVPDKKWFLSKYSSISAGYSFFRGGSASYISAPIGLQLNRRLNNNLYAFAGVSVAPTYINFNQPVPLSGMNKGFYGNTMFGPNNFGIYPRAEMGLMYINDEKTFSISGSISVQRNSYQVFPNQPAYNVKQNPAVRPNN